MSSVEEFSGDDGEGSDPSFEGTNGYLITEEAINLRFILIEHCRRRGFPFLNKPLHKMLVFPCTQ